MHMPCLPFQKGPHRLLRLPGKCLPRQTKVILHLFPFLILSKIKPAVGETARGPKTTTYFSQSKRSLQNSSLISTVLPMSIEFT